MEGVSYLPLSDLSGVEMEVLGRWEWKWDFFRRESIWGGGRLDLILLIAGLLLACSPQSSSVYLVPVNSMGCGVRSLVFKF